MARHRPSKSPVRVKTEATRRSRRSCSTKKGFYNEKALKDKVSANCPLADSAALRTIARAAAHSATAKQTLAACVLSRCLIVSRPVGMERSGDGGVPYRVLRWQEEKKRPLPNARSSNRNHLLPIREWSCCVAGAHFLFIQIK